MLEVAALSIEIESLTFNGTEVPALKDIDIRIAKGEFVLITGATASGKSVFCHALSGAIPLFQPASVIGEIKIFGHSTKDLTLLDVVQYLGFMQQDPKSQSFNVTVEEDIAFALGNLCRPVQDIRERVQKALAEVNLTGYADRGPETLSGGEAQRAILAGLLALDPQVMILDQPTSEMDPVNRQRVWNVLAALNRSGRTLVMVENELDDLLPLASRVLVMNAGRIVDDIRLKTTTHLTSIVKSARIKLDHELRQHSGSSHSTQDYRPVISFKPDPLVSPSIAKPTTIKFADCSFAYANGVRGMDNINLEICPGEFAAIVGPNGSGKTTLAKHINGLLKPLAGKVFINGKDTKGQKVEVLAREVGFLFQNPDYQIFSFSILEEVSFSLKVRGLKRAEINLRAEQALAQVGLWDLRHQHPYSLSRGQRQLLSVASILITELPILVVDEPTTGLDRVQAENVMNLLLDLQEQNNTVILISHNHELIRRYASRSIFMQEGKIKADLKNSQFAKGLDVFEGRLELGSF